MNLVLLGPPGAGKGTQAIRLAKALGIPHISTGDMFRRAVAEKTDMGQSAKKYMDRGELVPDDIVIGIVGDRLNEADCDEGFLLDGFPRTVAQAEALDEALKADGRRLDKTINIAVGRTPLIKRLTGRRTCRACGKIFHMTFDPPKSPMVCDVCGGELWQRDDDAEQTVNRRLDVYESQTAPLIEYYEDNGLLLTIDGEKDVQSVFEAIETALGI